MTKTQAKFTLDADVYSAFKARCADHGVSMATVIGQWMHAGQPQRANKARVDTRPYRRKAVLDIIRILYDILDREADYRDSIPQQFEQRLEAAERSCELLTEAIETLEDAF